MIDHRCPSCGSYAFNQRKDSDEWNCEDCGHQCSDFSPPSHQMKIVLCSIFDEYRDDTLIIQKYLQKNECKVELHQELIQEGSEHAYDIKNYLDDCDRLVLLVPLCSIQKFDRNYPILNGKSFCPNVINEAINRHIPVIPIFLIDIKDSLPECIQHLEFSDKKVVIPIIDNDDADQTSLEGIISAIKKGESVFLHHEYLLKHEESFHESVESHEKIRNMVNEISLHDKKPTIAIIGCGGAGNNTINRLHHLGVPGAQTIAVNTNTEHLDMIQADTRILIGKTLTKGLGAGGYPDVGRKSAEMARPTLEIFLESVDLCFITTGVGGGTGTGSAPVIARIAKDQGAIVIGIVTYPFITEKSRLIRAAEGLEEMVKSCDSVILLDMDRLIPFIPNLPLAQSFSVMDQIIAETIISITAIITEPSVNNFNYTDFKSIISRGGIATLLLGESKLQNKVETVVRECFSNPIFDVDYQDASGAMICITCGSDLTIRESEKIVSSLTSELDIHENFIWGINKRNDMEGRVRVIAILTGFKHSEIIGQPKYSVRKPLNEIDHQNKTLNASGEDCIKPRISTECSIPGEPYVWYLNL